MCALVFPLAGCGGKQCSPMPSMSRPPLPRTFTQTVEVFQVAFDMVLVPGDEAKGIKTLYVGRHEVTWEEFMPWATVADLPDQAGKTDVRGKKLRPSELKNWSPKPQGEGVGWPAGSMTRLAAETYCRWLSELTGRKYRLPTETEWRHCYQSGTGGRTNTLSAAEADNSAVYEANSFDAAEAEYRCRRVGSKQPDLNGIYDLAGNVAEWVMDTGGEQVVMGGLYRSAADALGWQGRIFPPRAGEWSVPPQYVTEWWNGMTRGGGFRLVCEP